MWPVQVFTVGFAFLAPGYALTVLLYRGRDRPDAITRLALSLGLSYVLLAITGFVLGRSQHLAEIWRPLTGQAGISARNLWLLLLLQIAVYLLLAYLLPSGSRHGADAGPQGKGWLRPISEPMAALRGAGRAISNAVRQIRSWLRPGTWLFAPRGANTGVGLALLSISAFAIVVAVKVAPLIHFDGLPGGDAITAVFWARRVIETGLMPDYSYSLTFNILPVDVNLPSLHFHLAAVSLLTGLDPIYAVGPVMIFSSLALALLTYAITLKIRDSRLEAILAALFVSLVPVMLRYTTIPGYHYGNLPGEVMILLTILLLLKSVGPFSPFHLALAVVSSLVLFTSHALSTFMAGFILPGVVALLALAHIKDVRLPRTPRGWRLLGMAVALGVIAGGLALYTQRSLLEELTAKFSKNPAYRFTYVEPHNFPPDMNQVLFALAGLGLLLCLVSIWRGPRRAEHGLLLWWLGAVVLLTQGPRIGIDVEGGRAYNYLGVPVAILAAIGAGGLFRGLPAIGGRTEEVVRATLSVAVVALPILGASQYVANNYAAARSSPREGNTNEEIVELGRWFQQNAPKQALVLDDFWNSARLANLLMFDLRAADMMGPWMSVNALRAYAFDLREEIKVWHENVTDFQKVFMLGNSPLALHLLQKQGFSYVVTTRAQADVFSHGPLVPVYYTQNYVVFLVPDTKPDLATEEDVPFLLAPLTLVNDLGDINDLGHGAQFNLPGDWAGVEIGGKMGRRAGPGLTYIAVDFQAYVQWVWDRNGDGEMDWDMKLLLRYFDNGVKFEVYDMRTAAPMQLQPLGIQVSGQGTSIWKTATFTLPRHSLARRSFLGWHQEALNLGFMVEAGDPLILNRVALGPVYPGPGTPWDSWVKEAR